MWQPCTKETFMNCIEDLLADEKVQAMNEISQHTKSVSCFDHSLFVAYVSFFICKKFNLDFKSAARAGLLHDLYLCDWNALRLGRFKRLLIHPQMALTNAECFGLSDLEKDIIENHMWPITLLHIPQHRESFVVNIADKLCAAAEMLHLYHIFRSKDVLKAFGATDSALSQA